MLKLCEWLVYIIMRPHKNFQHLIFFLAILIGQTEQIAEKKNRKEIRNPYLAPRRSQPTPAQPAHRGRGVFFPLPRLQAARWNATELAGDDTSPSRSF